MEEGAWVRRSGTHFAGTTRNGLAGRVIPYAFQQAAPYVMEFTDGIVRMFAIATQTSGLTTPLPADFRLVTTNDNQQVSSISTANPAVVATGATHGWTTGDQVQFLFATTVNAGFTPLLRARLFKITVTDTTHFSLSDPITLASIDGSTLGWSAPAANTVIVVRILALATPYTSGKWSAVRKVQAETQAILLHATTPPQQLKAVNLPTASAFAVFSLSKVDFKDGPYLDPPTDGTVLTPAVTAASQGTLPTTGNWTAIAWNGTVFCAVQSGSAIAATSVDGLAWTQRVLPASAQWCAIAWNGTVFCAIATPGSGTTNIAATSPDGIAWTQRTLSTSGTWNSIAWNGTVFCVVGIGNGGIYAMTSPDGITWTNRTLAAAQWYAITTNGAGLFCAIASSYSNQLGIFLQDLFPNISATSSDGITWTQHSLPVLVNWIAIGWNGTVFCAIGPGNAAITSSDSGVTWTQRTLPLSLNWTAITANGAGLFVAVATGNSSASSPDGIAWTIRAMPATANWDGIAWNGTVFCAVASGSAISTTTTTGSFSFVTITASSLLSINSGAGFVSTDIGRAIRLFSEPLNWSSATAYVVGNAVKFNNAYYISIQNGTGKQPDISPTYWALSNAAAVWTWGRISAITSKYIAVISLTGADILYPTTQIVIWRLGTYSDTTGYPTCGTYYQGRLWLSGAVPNRIDATVSNQISDMTPTGADGTVSDKNAISYTFNSDEVNPVFWMIGTAAGVLCGTQEGEWLVSAPTTGPITPTNIAAHRGTTYGCANVEPEPTEITISFVQRFTRKVLEYFPDVFSGRYIAPNLTQHAKHLTTSGIAEIRYQQELLPTLWTRCVNGSLIGASYKRSSLFSSQPPDFIGWHRHDFGSARTVESIAVGPSTDGTLDTLAMVTNDAATGIRHVEFMESVFDVSAPITSGWFCDDAIVPSGGTIVAAGVNSTLTFYGLWHLNGKTVTVWCGGIDVGDFAVANGAVTVPIDSDVAGLFTSAYLTSISSTTAYGAKATLIDGPYGRLTVPTVVGFTYTSQGQMVRPDWQEGSLGTSQAKPGRIHQLGGLLSGCQGISFGTDFTRLHSANFKTANGRALTALQLFTGVYWETVDDDWNFDSMLCWQISRPYPAALASISGFIQMTQR